MAACLVGREGGGPEKQQGKASVKKRSPNVGAGGKWSHLVHN